MPRELELVRVLFTQAGAWPGKQSTSERSVRPVLRTPLHLPAWQLAAVRLWGTFSLFFSCLVTVSVQCLSLDEPWLCGLQVLLVPRPG